MFRLFLLFTSPTLSDDIYRYIWDGHLLNEGLNPYSLPVDSPLLDPYNIPARALVNHRSMATPYLPVAQLLFGVLALIAPGGILAFQIAAVTFDLLTGWLVMDLLRRLNLHPQYVLLYLWNPLVVVEFAHSAHLDALMICTMMAAFWFWVRTNDEIRIASPVALAAAAMTKLLPILLMPLFLARWGWKHLLLFATLILLLLAAFSFPAGWGLIGPLDGTGLFGALRIYLANWNYNSGIYHWLEVWLSGYNTPGAVPLNAVTHMPIMVARGISAGMIALSSLLAGWLGWRHRDDALSLLRISLIPSAATCSSLPPSTPGMWR